MTADQRFLKAAHIRPDDPIKENWMEWRTNEVTELRMSVANWINQAAESDARGKRWRAFCISRLAIRRDVVYDSCD
jgi:hypothetical protein